MCVWVYLCVRVCVCVFVDWGENMYVIVNFFNSNDDNYDDTHVQFDSIKNW